MSATNEEIVERLDILITLLIPAFDEEKYPIAGIGVDVLKLCDAQHTITEIVTKLKKTKGTIKVTLSKLRSLGLIRSVTKNAKVYYVRII